MPSDIGPKKFQEVAHKGFERFRNFRNARLMFLRNYVGQYYDAASGNVGTEPLNLIFNAIRILVPNIVMNFPSHSVRTEYLAYQEYAEMQSQMLSVHDQQISIDETYRAAIVDAVFTLGILKTGIAESDSVYALDDYDRIDAGEVYTEKVDFDNFVVDPDSQEHMFRDAAFMGDRICVAREVLLESGLYNNEYIERLPSVADQYGREGKASQLSMRDVRRGDNTFLREKVELIELYVPEMRATITIPGGKGVSFDDYLRATDAYCSDRGPYTLLALTPPVPGNPLPVPAVGIWNDLHIIANRMAKKLTDQALRQRDILTYRRAAADDAQEVVDSEDGDAIAVEDPTSMNTVSIGGQQQSNEIFLAQTQSWFNMMAANPEATGGQRFDADSATEARILARNSSIGLEDMRDLVYKMAAREARNRAWYFHTDPFINQPLTRRVEIPMQFEMSPQGPVITQMPEQKHVQVFLTPEARRGDFLDYTFSVEPESMSRKDSQTRFQEAMDFGVKILPAAMSAAQSAMMLGVPFDVKEYIVLMAKDRGIDWMDRVWYDPDFKMKMMMQMMRGPSPENSKGQPVTPNPGTGQAQNGQPGTVMKSPSLMERVMSDFQSGANAGQQMVQGSGAY